MASSSYSNANGNQSPGISEGAARPWESRAILLLSVFFLALASAPQIVAWATTPEGMVYTGVLRNSLDVASYYAKEFQGAEGAWRYTNRFTPEPSRPAILFLFYLLLGHLARWLSISTLLSFQIARVVCGGAALWAIARLTRAMGLRGWTRAVAFTLAVAGSGLGWIGYGTGATPKPLELNYIDAYVFQSITNYPHFSLALAALSLGLGEMFQFATGGPAGRPARRLALVALAAFLLVWAHPRVLVTLFAVGAMAAFVGWRWRVWPWRPWIASLACAFAVAAPCAALTVISIWGDPVWASGAAEPVMTSPAPFEWFVLAYGALGPLAVAGTLARLRRADATQKAPAVFILIWIFFGALLVYLPVNSQSRLALGLGIPLGVGAAWAISEIARRARLNARPVFARIGTVTAIVIFLSLGVAVYLHAEFARIARHDHPLFISRDRMRAYEWLRANTGRDDVVFASFRSGMFIPGLTGARVIVGHSHETPNANEREREIQSLLRHHLPEPEWNALVERHGIDYALITPLELTRPDETLSPPEFDLVFSSGEAKIFRRRAATMAAP